MPAVSHFPFIIACRFLGLIPGRRMEGLIKRKRDIAPFEVGVTRAAAETMIIPIRLIDIVSRQVKEQAEEESGKEKAEKQ
ncbi:MAG: hypothetical protein HZB81_03070 [Deltaproteobacteria bacterium]|nr:hypothetical protein [Deltaproteobacteria bacterium]